MQPDDWKAAWAAHGAALERSLRIDERLLRELLHRKVRAALTPYAIARGIEVCCGVLVQFAVVSVVSRHLSDPRYLWIGGALALYALAMTVLCGHLLVRSLRVDLGGPVASIQREIERLQWAEYASFKWALLGGVVFWLPVPLFLLEVLSGADWLARVDLPWLAANVAVGLALLGLGQVLSRRFVEQRGHDGRAPRLIQALSGAGLRRAQAHLDDLARFMRDDD